MAPFTLIYRIAYTYRLLSVSKGLSLPVCARECPDSLVQLSQTNPVRSRKLHLFDIRDYSRVSHEYSSVRWPRRLYPRSYKISGQVLAICLKSRPAPLIEHLPCPALPLIRRADGDESDTSPTFFEWECEIRSCARTWIKYIKCRRSRYFRILRWANDESRPWQWDGFVGQFVNFEIFIALCAIKISHTRKNACLSFFYIMKKKYLKW